MGKVGRLVDGWHAPNENKPTRQALLLSTQIAPVRRTKVSTRGSHFGVQKCMANRLFRADLSGLGSGRDLQQMERKCDTGTAVKTG